ncbi:hypothetical protein EG328_005680 [Venturia inaequalis]|uniref:SET domain-containing protein n=3 Tax=Venturia inaequalis TaxID=5025 RepID=A0A8H3Z5T4_VENIN|nr:hypothetical protein EG328_005680 [Venturia inaequalis]
MDFWGNYIPMEEDTSSIDDYNTPVVNEFQELTARINANPVSIQSWKDRASFFCNHNFLILGIADAYKVYQLAAAAASVKNPSDMATQEYCDISANLQDLLRVIIKIEDPDELTSYLMLQSEWEKDETSVEKLTAPTWSRQVFPWMPPRDTFLESIKAFFQKHKLELRPSEMFDPPNPDILGVFARRRFRQGNKLFDETAMTAIRPREKCKLGSRDDLLERFVRRLVSSQMTYGIFRDQIAMLHHRNTPIHVPGEPRSPPPSKVSLDFSTKPPHRGNIVKIENTPSYDVMDPRTYVLRLPYITRYGVKLGDGSMDIDIDDLQDIHPITRVNYQRMVIGDCQKPRYYFKRMAMEEEGLQELRAYGLGDADLSSLSITYGTAPQTFNFCRDVKSVLELIDRNTPCWTPQVDFWVILAMKWKLDTNSFSLEEYASGEAKAKGIGKHFSFLNHSCSPNAEWQLHTDDDSVVTIYVTAIKPIKRGEEVFISYIKDYDAMTVAERRDKLQPLLGCDCQCKRCKRESRESNDEVESDDTNEDDNEDDNEDSDDEGGEGPPSRCGLVPEAPRHNDIDEDMVDEDNVVNEGNENGVIPMEIDFLDQFLAN